MEGYRKEGAEADHLTRKDLGEFGLQTWVVGIMRGSYRGVGGIMS